MLVASRRTVMARLRNAAKTRAAGGADLGLALVEVHVADLRHAWTIRFT
jgi:hypothetical protein